MIKKKVQICLLFQSRTYSSRLNNKREGSCWGGHKTIQVEDNVDRGGQQMCTARNEFYLFFQLNSKHNQKNEDVEEK